MKDKFLQEYDGRPLEDAIMYNSEEVRDFSRKFRAYLKRSLPGCNIAGYLLGHYYISAFLERGGRFVYLNYSIPRHGEPINVETGRYGGAHGSVLVRKALDTSDYSGRGGCNEFCSLSTIPEAVEALLSQEGGR